MDFCCPRCKTVLRTRAGDAGKQVQCPGCGMMLIVPQPTGGDIHEVPASRGTHRPRSRRSRNRVRRQQGVHPGTLIGVGLLLAGIVAMLLIVAVNRKGREDREQSSKPNRPDEPLVIGDPGGNTPPPPSRDSAPPREEDPYPPSNNDTNTTTPDPDSLTGGDDTRTEESQTTTDGFDVLPPGEGEGRFPDRITERYGLDDLSKHVRYVDEAALKEAIGQWDVIGVGQFAIGDQAFESLLHAPVVEDATNGSMTAFMGIEIRSTQLVFREGLAPREFVGILQVRQNMVKMDNGKPLKFYWYAVEQGGKRYKALCVRRPEFDAAGRSDLDAMLLIPSGRHDPFAPPAIDWYAYPHSQSDPTKPD